MVDKATEVLNVLVHEAQTLGTAFSFGAPVTDVEARDGGFTIHTEERPIFVTCVVIATGGGAMVKAAYSSGHPALEFKNLTYINSLDDSKALNERKDPMIILSASGMAEAGRIVYHIRWAIENKKNTIMIVSWQSPETLGRRLADRVPNIKIFGDTYKCRAEIATIGGLSAHAGQDVLVEYAAGIKNSAEYIFLVHGEDKGVLPLKEKFRENRVKHVYYPAMHTCVEL